MVNVIAIGKGLKTTAEIIGAVTAVVGVAGELKDNVQPIVDSEEGRAVMEKTKGAFGSIKDKAAAAKGAIGGTVQKAVESKDEWGRARAAIKKEKVLAKQLKKARQLVLEGASQTVSFREFAKTRKEGIGSVALAAGLYSGPGCFVIATYSNLDFDKDLTDYLYIYVGKGEALGDAIEFACSREGDSDLYADVKYKQNVHVYAYPCIGETVEEKYTALFSLFSDSQN